MTDLHRQIQEAIAASGLSPTELGKAWNNGTNPRSNEQRIRRLLRVLPTSLADLESLLEAIDHKIEIRRK